MSTEQHTLRAEADRLWRTIVVKRADNRCELCQTYGTFAHHLRGRADKRLRWNPDNGIALCWTCHKLAHEHQPEFLSRLALVLPARADWLDNISTTLRGVGPRISMPDVITELSSE